MPNNEELNNPLPSSVQEVSVKLNAVEHGVMSAAPKPQKSKLKLYSTIFLVTALILVSGYFYLFKNDKRTPVLPTEQKSIVQVKPTKEQLTEIVQSKSTELNSVIEKKSLEKSDLPKVVSGLLDGEARNLSIKEALLDGVSGWIIKYSVQNKLNVAYQRLDSARVQKWLKILGVVGENSGVMEIQYPRPELEIVNEAYKVKVIFTAENSESEKTDLEIRAIPLK